jgi:superfamily II DNA or RNA helicase
MRPLVSTWKAEGPFAEQKDILATLQHVIAGGPWGGGILQAGCGAGKTQIGVELAHRIGRSTMILVHKEFLLRQWKDRIESVLPGARVGIVQQDREEWQGVDFCIALMQSLARDEGKKYDQRMYEEGFGFILVDECHHVPSATFSDLVPRFRAAYRLGLSATPRRKDGAEDVFYYQIGPVVYEATAQAMVPKVRALPTRARLRDIRRGRYHVPVDQLNSAQVTTQLSEDPVRQRQVVDQVLRAVRVGRKVLVVSERLEHLRDMSNAVAAALPTMGLSWESTQGFYVGQWFSGGKKRTVKQDELTQAATCQVVWATKQIMEEGADIPALDVLVMATPISDAEQVVGRVRRWCTPEAEKCARLCAWRAGTCEGKPDPVVVDLVDNEVPKVIGKWRKRQRMYREMGARVED